MDESLGHRNATSFAPLTGARALDDVLSQQFSAQFGENETILTQLDQPSEALVDHVLSAAQSVPSIGKLDVDEAKEIIVDILKACFYFNVTDIRHIAYVFATLSHECLFGKKTIEDGDEYYLSQYEPLFLVAQDKPEKPDDTFYKKINAGCSIMEKLVEMLTKIANQKVLTDIEIPDMKKILFMYMMEYRIEKPDEFIKKLESLKDKTKASFMDVCESFMQILLQDTQDKFISALFAMQDVKNFARKLGVSKKRILSDFNQLLTKEYLRFYRISLFPMFLQKMLKRVRLSHALGNNCIGDGEKYKGRGFVQITGRSNYEKFSRLISEEKGSYFKALCLMGVRFDDDVKKMLPELLINEPDIAAENTPIAAVIAVGGMSKDGFVSKRKVLSSYGYGSFFDFVGARKIINPDKNGEKISIMAQTFLTALQHK